MVERHEDILAVDQIVAVGGRVDRREDGVQLICTRMESLKKAPPSVDINLSMRFMDERDNAHRLRDVLRRHPGAKRVVFYIKESGTHVYTSKPKVSGDPGMIAELEELLGADSVVA